MAFCFIMYYCCCTFALDEDAETDHESVHVCICVLYTHAVFIDFLVVLCLVYDSFPFSSSEADIQLDKFHHKWGI